MHPIFWTHIIYSTNINRGLHKMDLFNIRITHRCSGLLGVKFFLGGRHIHHSFRSSVHWCWDWAWLTGRPYWSSPWLFSNALYPVMMGGNCLIITDAVYVSGTWVTILIQAGHANWANCAGKCQEKHTWDDQIEQELIVKQK